MKKIMVCYDGSEPSHRALELAVEQARAFDGEMFLVTTMEKGDPQKQAQINQAKQDLESAQSRVAAQNIACQSTLLIHGMGAGEDIVKFAEDKGIDLLLIGIMKKSKVGKLLFGSTAQFVILKAPCPVLTVK